MVDPQEFVKVFTFFLLHLQKKYLLLSHNGAFETVKLSDDFFKQKTSYYLPSLHRVYFLLVISKIHISFKNIQIIILKLFNRRKR